MTRLTLLITTSGPRTRAEPVLVFGNAPSGPRHRFADIGGGLIMVGGPRARWVAAAAMVCAAVLPLQSVDAAPSGGALPPQLTQVLQIAGVSGVPDDAVGVALNVTVTNPMAAGFLTVYPCGDRPLASNLNYVADQTVPNFVIVGLNSDGAVCIDTMTTTDVVVDLAGYIPAGSDLTPLTAPTRFLDTRIGLGAPTRVGGLSITEVPLAGGFGVPEDAQSVVINTTVVDPEAAGYISVFPCDDGGALTNGGTSTLNFAAGQIVPNLVTTAVGAAGKVCVYSTVGADLVADVAAYVPAGGTGLTTMPFPRRFVDTRFGLGGPVAPLGSDVRTVEIGGVNGVPADTGAVIANITATRGSGAGYLTAFPCGQPVPLVSNVNFMPGQSIANMAVVALGPGGRLCMRAMVPVDVIVDVTGYVTGTDGFVPLSPSRIYDSRDGVEPPCGIGLRPVPQSFELINVPAGTPGPPLENAPQFLYGNQRAFVGPDCTAYLVGYVSSGGQIAYAYSPQGTRLGAYLLPSGMQADNVRPTLHGLIGVLHDLYNKPAVIELTSGAVLFELPERPTTRGYWSMVGATADGQFLALMMGAFDDGANDVEYWTIDGTAVGRVELHGAVPMAMSPSGKYLMFRSVYDISRETINVSTLDGTVVASVITDEFNWMSVSTFMTDGSLIGCIPGSEGHGWAGRWDLFTAPKPLIPTRPEEPCIPAAG